MLQKSHHEQFMKIEFNPCVKAHILSIFPLHILLKSLHAWLKLHCLKLGYVCCKDQALEKYLEKFMFLTEKTFYSVILHLLILATNVQQMKATPTI